MKQIIIYIWLSVISVALISVMLSVMEWTDRIVEQARVNSVQEESISILSSGLSTNQSAIIQILKPIH